MERTYYPPNMNFRNKKYKPQNKVKAIKVKDKKTYPQFERSELCDLKYFGIRKWRKGQIQRQ